MATTLAMESNHHLLNGNENFEIINIKLDKIGLLKTYLINNLKRSLAIHN